MTISRRRFLGTMAVGGAASAGMGTGPGGNRALAPGGAGSPDASPPPPQSAPGGGFDPWIEIDRAALVHNAGHVARLTGRRPIVAVVKNNAYGLGLTTVAPLLEALPEVQGLAVVKAEAALRLREAGIQKPVLLMGMMPDDSEELVRAGVTLSVYTDDALDRVAPVAARLRRPVPVQLYLDTGMGRMGMPYHRASGWMRDVAADPRTDVRGTFMAFTESDFDPEQLRRFLDVTRDARAAGADLGALHAASSNGVFHLPDAHLDLVRPGIAIYGSYPSRPDEERALAELRPACSLKARVVRVERLRAGDSVSYGRGYVAAEPTWSATLPAGHTDGVTRNAVNGARVLIGGRTYPAIGAVSASHTIVELGSVSELGEESPVRVGDVATLLGPEHGDIHPNELARVTGTSVYDRLMHLDPGLPRIVV